jgi:uncharacterized protein (TIGR02186 family)
MKYILIFLISLQMASVSYAQENLRLELAEDRVDITTGFDGTRVVAFGTVKSLTPSANMVVTLRGPETKTIVREKRRAITGVWSNDESVEFRRVPSYYDYALKNVENESDILADIQSQAQIGTENLSFYSEENLKPEELEPFHDALIRQMQSKGFYAVKPTRIEFTDGELFKVTFVIPPGVPTGTYTAEAVLFEGEKIMERVGKTLQVGQVGFNARVYVFAEEYSFFYGLLAILMAVTFGWSAFTFLRRD